LLGELRLILLGDFQGLRLGGLVILMEMFEEELRIDEGIVLLSGHFLVGHVESVVGLGVIWIVLNGVPTGLDAWFMLLEFEVAEGEVSEGCIVIIVFFLQVFQVALDGPGDVSLLHFFVSAFLQRHTTIVIYKYVLNQLQDGDANG
jgi:hypothetical protein